MSTAELNRLTERQMSMWVKTVATAITDQDGNASFRLSRIGRFDLEIEEKFSEFTAVILEVSDSGKANEIVSLDWPAQRIMDTSSLSGVLHTTVYKTGEADRLRALAGVSISLEDEYGRILQSSASSSKGLFSFHRVQDGLYFIHISERDAKKDPEWNIDGYIPVMLKSTFDANLNLRVDMSDCGISYERAEERPH